MIILSMYQPSLASCFKSVIRITFILFFFLPQLTSAQSWYDKKWEEVYQQEVQGLSQSAYPIVESIFKRASKKKDSYQLVKAYLHWSKYKLMLFEDTEIEVLKRLEQEIDRAEVPAKNLLRSVYAGMLEQYLRKNRYRISRRTPLSTSAEPDIANFQSWDILTMVKEINKRYDASLVPASELLAIDVTDAGILLTKADKPAPYRPTLYDLLAHRAIDFHEDSWPGLPRKIDSVNLKSPHLLGLPDQFQQLTFVEEDTVHSIGRAFNGYQRLEAIHNQRADTTAMIDVFLLRLEKARKKTLLEQKDSLFFNSLQQALDKYEDHPASALIAHTLASMLFDKTTYGNSKNDPELKQYRIRALEYVNWALENHPDSDGGIMARILKPRIAKPKLSLTTQGTVLPGKPVLSKVAFKAVDSLYINIYTLKDNDIPDPRYGNRDAEAIKYMMANKPVITRFYQLQPRTDYFEHTTEIDLPALSLGRYLLVASETPEPGPKDLFGYQELQVSSIAVLTLSTNKYIEYRAVDRQSGLALANLSYTAYEHGVPYKSGKSDSRGRIRFKKPEGKSRDIYLELMAPGDTLKTSEVFLRRYGDDDEDEEFLAKASLFLDRSIYRPGQTVYYKGLLIQTRKGKSSVVPGVYVTINIYDTNGDEIHYERLKTNEFGSVSGSYTLPMGLLTGEFSIEMDEDYNEDGDDDPWWEKPDDFEYREVYFSVEEYKRPRFSVALEAPGTNYALGDTVQIKGLAQAFMGTPVDQAEVRYKVTRRTEAYDPWEYMSANTTIIITDTTTTDADGNFMISFPALPDVTADKKEYPVFNYTIEATVTDISGETRTGERDFRMGYQNLRVDMHQKEAFRIDEKIALELTATDLNGLPAEASVDIQVVPLIAPERLLLAKRWDLVDWQYLDKQKYLELFPHEVYEAVELQEHWPEGDPVFEFTGEVNDSIRVELPGAANWKAGTYRVKLFAKNKAGDTLSVRKDLKLLPVDEKAITHPVFLSWEVTDPLKISEERRLKIALRTAVDGLPVQVYAVHNGELFYDKVIEIAPGTTNLKIPLSSKISGNIQVGVLSVWNNSSFQNNKNLRLPETEGGLKVETLSFRDRLLPDAGETWSFKVTDHVGQAANAEFLASMYDYSLEEFKEHRWETDLTWEAYTYYVGVNFYTDQFMLGNYRSLNYGRKQNLSRQLKNYPHLEWFGLDLGDPERSFNRYIPRDITNKGSGNVKGVVVDEDGLPLPGTTVIVQGTSQGTQTDFDGLFSLDAKIGDVLEVTYIGYKTQRIVIDKIPAVINVSLEADSQALEEVVVVGYAIEEEADSVLVSKAAGVEILEQLTTVSPGEAEVKVRTDLGETAFFMPHLTTDEKGGLYLNFKAPQALTQWRMMLLGHTKAVKKGYTEKYAVTQKELSVLPNLPRFMRSGDTLTLTARLQNLTEGSMQAEARLELRDATTGKSVKMFFQGQNESQLLTIPAKRGGVARWTLVVPNGLQGLEYKITARAGTHTDGEGGVIPVLENRRLLMESHALWVPPGSSTTVGFENMKVPSATREDLSFSLEYTSNPTWTAITSLPYLIEFPYECAEQTFARYYANALGGHLLAKNPEIRAVFDQWVSDSKNINKQEEAKQQALLKATPWLKDLQSDKQQRARLSALFDETTLEVMGNNTLAKLKELQLSSGAFPWFSGGRDNAFITRHILAGFGHLKVLEQRKEYTTQEKKIIEKALHWTDAYALERFRRMKERDGKPAITTAVHHYLYMRAFYREAFPPEEAVTAMIDEYLSVAAQDWLKEEMYVRALMVNYLFSWNKEEQAQKMITALKEQSVMETQYGMYWKANKKGWYWYRSPVETQALLIEGFAKAGEKKEVLDAMKIWLLRQKQIKNWPTTKATTEAIYALIMEGSDWLSVKDQTVIRLGDNTIRSAKLRETEKEAGTGYMQLRWSSKEVTPEMAEITVKNKSEVPGYGGVYWTYFEAADKVRASGSKDLSVTKKVFVQKETMAGSRLVKVDETAPIEVGDLVTVRLEITAGSDLEFLHLEDLRASGLEPVDVISGYRWQDGLGYYQSTRDLATHFFFDSMPKGVYVIEYRVRANHAGAFTNGFATLKSMYAPEFSAQSMGERIRIKE
ncbi:alpha-2-macroglobulin family protein [Robertkochia sediminum]|uniref:alpha-2-macroglobulin family protein n=1 Tax=Robertkochia sediminum TaxID=2785326 RepID=UPI001932C5F2|nr:MG2 domain-containing protein [Robertkochia sediminum]MBL7471412.1 carboxypeptidase-like regulatory domain-containing protein [Robertkochia sediminum]